MDKTHRTRTFAVIELLRFNIMMAFIYYFLTAASEELFKRKQYLKYKTILIVTYSLFSVLMLACAIWCYVDVATMHTRGIEFCIKPYYLILRWGPFVASIVFLIYTCKMHQQIK